MAFFLKMMMTADAERELSRSSMMTLKMISNGYIVQPDCFIRDLDKFEGLAAQMLNQRN